jgi:hypothetical protein
MKFGARERWTREFINAEIPSAMKALTAELALQAWYRLDQDVILAAWDFDSSYNRDSNDSEGSENDSKAFIDVEYGHDDVDAQDLALIISLIPLE